jgi:uncharacterized protein (UPF0261 family)
MPVILIGTLDTKGEEIAFTRDVLNAAGVQATVIDAGSMGPPNFVPEIERDEVFIRAGTTAEQVRARADRGEAVAAAARGVTAIVTDLLAQGTVQGLLGLGGSAGTVIGTAAMRAAPFGLPKVMVSTLASGSTRPFVGGSDIMMVSPVADIAGLNRLTRTALSNAAYALAGMVRARERLNPVDHSRILVGATMFGVTTPCVDLARRRLEAAGIEVVVFHATGVGGQSMEGLVRDGQIAAVLDITTTELADELVGGILSAGANRLEAAVHARIPQVLSVGALDMVNFGPPETIPPKFAGRRFHRHNPSVTLMRTTPEENIALGEWIARVVRQAKAPAVLMLPRGGVSALDQPGAPFFDHVADEALFGTLTRGLADHPFVSVELRDDHINDPAFADAAARNLLDLIAISKRVAHHDARDVAN